MGYAKKSLSVYYLISDDKVSEEKLLYSHPAVNIINYLIRKQKFPVISLTLIVW